jgi:hypothetical protein
VFLIIIIVVLSYINYLGNKFLIVLIINLIIKIGWYSIYNGKLNSCFLLLQKKRKEENKLSLKTYICLIEFATIELL